ncbi:MAG: hypothetical protein K2G45_07840 [Lachnospiraceae bacterium]|nr:hypothetical protein [Lachnospiraceae bacterium]
MSYLADEILQMPPYDYSDEEKKPGGHFYRALLEELCFHYDNNEKYRRFCDNKNFNPHTFEGEIVDIPPVHVSVFKELGGSLRSVPEDEIKLTLQSSATSGASSSVAIDRITSKRQSKAMVRVLSDFIGNTRQPFLVMDVNPREGFSELLGARYAAVSGYLKFASEVGYFLKVDKNYRYYFDIDGMKDFIKNLDPKVPAVLFGFTYILFSEILKPLESEGQFFSLPEGSKVIHIGGWKKLEAQKIKKEDFNQLTARIFGVHTEDVIDIYGFTEQMGLNYPDCKCGYKHASLYSEVIVRDVVTKKVLSSGKEGLLEFVSIVPHSYPGNVVLTDDIGYIVEEQYPCGRAGTKFCVTGRLKKAEIRGCGDILSSKLKFSDSSSEKVKPQENTFRVEFYRGKGLPAEQSIEQIEKSLRDWLPWIRRQPVDALIGLISKVAKKWETNADSNPSLKGLQNNGLGFLSAWCTPEHLIAVMAEGLRGNRQHVDGFVSISDSVAQSQKAVSRGLICHWLAGNVQVLGMFVLIESILTKNVNLLKVSSRDEGVFRAMLEAFDGESFTTVGGHTILGDDLLKTISLVYYGHSEKSIGEKMSAMADVRVAWGGKEAVETVSQFPAKFDCEDLIMGPKLSFSVISKEALEEERKVKKLARRVAVDASVFDQTGCASAHNVFVERGGNISPKEFAQYLADGMAKTAVQIPKGDVSPEQISAIHSARGVYDFKGKVFGDDNSIWTVLYSEDLELSPPVYSRVVFVHPVENMEDVLPFVTEDIQTIGLAAEGKRAEDFAIMASEQGAMRFPVCGRMLKFDSPWDGMYLMDRMVRWVTLGGPLV